MANSAKTRRKASGGGTVPEDKIYPNLEREKWDDANISKAARIMLAAEKNKSMLIRILDEIVHWLIIIVTIFGNVIISTVIVFISPLIEVPYFYSVIMILALSFGFLIEIPLREVERLDKNKHFLSRLLLPILALVNIYVLIGLKNAIEYFSKIEFNFNPVTAGIVYGCFFLLPHYLMWFLKKKNTLK